MYSLPYPSEYSEIEAAKFFTSLQKNFIKRRFGYG
jgi:hypothetical protein